MPNSNNFPNKLNSIVDVRPSRTTDKDNTLIRKQSSDGDFIRTNVVFGQTLRDVIEFYVYNDVNEIVAHTNIRPNDTALRLVAFVPEQSAGVGQDNIPDFLQIDLVNVINRLDLPAGRYSVAVNFLRDEVGKEEDGIETKLYISAISPSRTELRIQPIILNGDITQEIREFVDPSVPRLVAQAVVDQAFGISINTSSEYSITLNGFIQELENIDIKQQTPDGLTVTERLQYANLEGSFYNSFNNSLELIRNKVLDLILERPSDLQVQDYELRDIIRQATRETLIEMVSFGLIDPLIQLIDSRGDLVTPTTTE